jgi:hypothetical protein
VPVPVELTLWARFAGSLRRFGRDGRDGCAVPISSRSAASDKLFVRTTFRLPPLLAGFFLPLVVVLEESEIAGFDFAAAVDVDVAAGFAAVVCLVPFVLGLGRVWDNEEDVRVLLPAAVSPSLPGSREGPNMGCVSIVDLSLRIVLLGMLDDSSFLLLGCLGDDMYSTKNENRGRRTKNESHDCYDTVRVLYLSRTKTKNISDALYPILVGRETSLCRSILFISPGR